MEYPCLVDLIDPKTEQPRQYLVSEDSIQECNAIQRGWSSWFIGNSVIGDGMLYLWTPVNVVFILLHALEKVQQKGNFCSIEHIVECMECGNDVHAILNVVESQKNTLKEVCDWKENDGECYFKLSEEKLFAWLKSRVAIVATDLGKRYPSFASMSRESLDLYSIGIISEYLSDARSEGLYKIFGLDKPSLVNVPPPDTLLKQESGKSKSSKKRQQQIRGATAREEEKAKKMKKEVAGMKKLTTFFGKKS